MLIKNLPAFNDYHIYDQEVGETNTAEEGVQCTIIGEEDEVLVGMIENKHVAASWILSFSSL